MAKQVEEFPVRATFYFNDEQLHQLDVATLRLKTEHGPEFRKVSKSEVMRTMFDVMMEDFLLNGRGSMLVRAMREKR